MPDRCTLLISSCDAYADIWPPFFALLKRYAGNLPYPLALSAETLEWDGALTPRGLHPDGPCSWTRRLQQALQQLDTPYVLLLLDDFFLAGPTDSAEIANCLDRMDDDPSIACFSFWPTTGNEGASPYEGYDKRPQNGLYRFNAQAGIWRRELLAEFLDADENAWEWESAGNSRSFTLPYGFYSRKPDATPVFCYDYMRWGLIGGKWFADTVNLFQREGLAVDFSRRGIYNPKEWALLPSVYAAFQLDSVLYLDSGSGFSEENALFLHQGKEGPFRQEYNIPQGTTCVRWDPSTHRGFSLMQLNVQAFHSGKSSSLLPCRGNAYLLKEGELCFLEEDPALFFDLPSGTTKLVISGAVCCPLSREHLDACDKAAHVQAPRRLFRNFLGRLRKK